MICFENLEFVLEDEKLYLTRCGNLTGLHSGFAEVQLCGENKDSHMGAKLVNSSEGRRLAYVDHRVQGDTLTIRQRSDLVAVDTVFTAYSDTKAIRIRTEVTNLTQEPVVLEEVSGFVLTGIGTAAETDELYFTRFHQSHHAECQPRRGSFRQWGLSGGAMDSQGRIACANVGSWSTKEELPQGIVEHKGGLTMFQIESNASWYYEISDRAGQYYLYLGGPNLPFGGWSRKLQPGERYETPWVALAFGSDLNEVLGDMTLYRRHIAGNCPADANLPTIFNEYMHLSWDSPTAENTARYAPVVAKTGAEYYVIDCGWHNEEPGDQVYPYVGQWKQSHVRFPEGLRKTTDYIRSLGMKPGLWIEAEIIGMQCREMLAYYDDTCFLSRSGKRLTVMNRHFLDYRNPKVRAYMTETVRRMVTDYGAAYIKVDYNQDCGVGTDRDAFSPGQGLEDSADAFLNWIRAMQEMFPEVIFEGCASGGMRMDYKTLSAYSLVSTSDQVDYLKYPCIVGNILSAVLPEQAAVWSYPVGSDVTDGTQVSDRRIVMNMVNSFLGRMHLASHLDWLDAHQLSLIREGVAYYNTLSEMKKHALPWLPLGFTGFGAEQVCAGLVWGKRRYLAMWNLGKPGSITVPVPGKISQTAIAYPANAAEKLSFTEDTLTVTFPEDKSAVFVELQTQS